MSGEKVSVNLLGRTQIIKQDELPQEEEEPHEVIVCDFTDIEELYDLVEWHLGEEWSSLQAAPLFCIIMRFSIFI